MKKETLFTLCVLTITFLLLLCPSSPAQEKQIVLRYATQLPATHMLTKADMRMAKMIEERTKGRVKVEVYPAGQLFKDRELIKAVMNGAIEMGITNSALMAGTVPLFDVFEMPFIYRGWNDLLKVWNGEPGAMMRMQLERTGMKALGFGAYGDNFDICSRKPLIKVEGFKGAKLRANTAPGADVMMALGASPVYFSSGEVYEALQRKMIDGASSGVSTIVERKWFEVTEYVTLTWCGYALWPIFINTNFLNSLPKNIQHIIIEAVQENQKYTISTAERSDREYAELLKKKVKVHELTASELKAWKDAGLRYAVDKWLKKSGEDGKKVLAWIEANIK